MRSYEGLIGGKRFPFLDFLPIKRMVDFPLLVLKRLGTIRISGFDTDV